MAKKSRKNRVVYDTDALAQKLWLTLVRDFRSSEGEHFCRKAEEALLAGKDQFRAFNYPEVGLISVGRFKRYKQMQNLLKKYRFAQDTFSDEELEKKTLTKYFREQERLAQPVPQNEFSKRILGRARAIARSILGSFPDPEDVVVQCKFGKKSSIGCSLSLAYIDEKLSCVKAFTGSSSCSRWFHNQVLPGDAILSELVQAIGSDPKSDQLNHETLTLVNVPKTWKTYRTITPLTLLSLFYSNGVGQLVTDRLRKSGLDISRLQNRHRSLVRKFSMSRTHATADLSAASDSITIELLSQILPREWYRAVRPALTSQVRWKTEEGERQAYTASVLPMGNGLTFPVETLIFYSLIKAIGDLTDTRGVFSVYGDDLIYPSRLHKYVVQAFPYFRLVLNLDKTFVRYPFRESCGADFYRGADVRPFFLRGERQLLTRSSYQAYLYKTYNGLVRRWDPQEIRQTLLFIITELLRVSDEILRAPPEFPDTAGIKVPEPWDIPLDLTAVPWAPTYLVLQDRYGNHAYAFKYLSEFPKRRFVKTVLPYYWLALQGLHDEPEEYNPSSTAHIPTEANRTAIQWRKRKLKRKYMRNGVQRTRIIVREVPTVASRTGVQLTTSIGLTHEWV